MIKKIFMIAAVAAVAAGCSSVSKMVQQAENVKIVSDPEVLEVIAGKVDATLTAEVPARYFNGNAIVSVTPVLVYDGGEVALRPFMYQGDKVKDNYKTVSSAGQKVTEKVTFDYEKGMESARLELRGKVIYKKKNYALPTRKVADGCNTTYMWVEKRGALTLRPDGYEAVVKQTAEGQIKYAVNSSEVSKKALKSQSVKDFEAALDEIRKNARKTVTGTEVVAYASPEGGEKLNSKLSGRRGETAGKALGAVAKDKGLSAPEIKSMGQDWEGFQELVAKSDIEDKDLILRVLSMYSDPAVRESEIRNLSQVFTSLKTTVLPELRRARFIANVEFQNYTDEELAKLVEENVDVLDESALLHAATIAKKGADREKLYKKAIDKFGSETARYNLAVSYLNSGKVSEAIYELDQLKDKTADVENALGVAALRKDNLAEASQYFAKAGNDDAKKNQAIIDILQGDYAKASAALDGTKSFNAALAHLLADNPRKAADSFSCSCLKTEYLKAVVAARIGDDKAVKEGLEKLSKSKGFAAKAAKDVEFARYR